MQISNQIDYKPQFRATKVATAYNYVRGKTAIDIFKLSDKDAGFIKKLSQKVSIKDVCPKLKQSFQERWQKVFDYCLQEAMDAGKNTYVAFSKGVPCAILTYHAINSKCNFLDAVSAIPDFNGEKTPLAGNTLIFQLFKDSLENKEKKGIMLDAIHNGPVDVVKKYKDLGFTEITENNGYTVMSCNKFKVAKEIDNFKKDIDYIETERERIDLEEYLD